MHKRHCFNLHSKIIFQVWAVVDDTHVAAVEVLSDEIPVFWACGVTPQAAIAHARPEFCITHAPGAMLITDLLNHHLAI